MRMLQRLWQPCLAHLLLCQFQTFFNGPIAGVQVGYVNGELVINPNQEQKEASLLELTLQEPKKQLTWLSLVPRIVRRADVEALLKGHEAVKELITFQEEYESTIC